ncbi:MAG: C10 family peptidase [Bacteroidales bacterium]
MRIKVFSLSLVIILIVFVEKLWGQQPVGLSAASKAALQWFYERSPWLPQDISIKEIRPIMGGEDTLFFVLNFFPKGFALISAHEGMVPVAAYSFESWYEDLKMPPAAKAWLGQYISSAQEARETGNFFKDETLNQWNALLNAEPGQRFRGKSVEPLTFANWNQDWPYNELCPADPAGPHGHCYAGCVPTAMGMIMYYYRWPDTGVGYYSYTQPLYGLLEADFGNTHYAWDEMTNQIDDSDTAIARLLFHIGVACDLVYGPTGSGMYNHKAAYAFRTYFKYAPETQYVFRDSTHLDWDSLLVAHLDRKMPMYYAGWSVPDINGHAFVCDGYQGTGYFHFNFGWGGSFNGYYYTGNLTPGGNNFNLAQEVIINCHPDTINYDYPGIPQPVDTLRHYVGSFTDGSGPRLPQYAQPRSWLISPQNAIDSITSIKISFSRFDLKNGESFVNVYDGNDASAPLLASLTGSDFPSVIQSSGNQLFVEYIGAASANNNGFVATYEGLKPQWCSGSQLLSEPSGYISDGSGNFWYYNNTVCIWRIQPPDAKQIAIYFKRFSTEPGQDKLRIYDFSTAQLLAEYSGHYDSSNLPPPVLCPSGKVFLTFSTNGSVRDDGWEAFYESYFTGMDVVRPQEIKFFPNPAKEFFYVMMKGEDLLHPEAELMSADGRCQKKVSLIVSENGGYVVHTKGLSSGVWFLRVMGKKNVYVGKVLIEQ